VFFTEVSAFAVGLMLLTYAIRVLGITVGYHRYFSHRAFRCGRGTQFALALMGASAVQRGPLWWAAHHRHHHKHSDGPEDAHSPVQDSFLWSHMLWFLSTGNYRSRTELISDFAKFPELRFIDRFDTVVPILSYTLYFFIGYFYGQAYPESGVTGGQTLLWAGVVGTVLAYHATFTINSLVHVFGAKRYKTGDESRNNPWLWWLTFGESWHNNHHHFAASARLGFYWWEVDIGWYFLKALERLGLVRGEDSHRRPVMAVDHDRVGLGPVHDRLFPVVVDRRLGGRHHAGAHLDAIGAHGQGRRHRGAVDNAACGDDRYVETLGDLGDQHKGRCTVGILEPSAFRTFDNQTVDPCGDRLLRAPERRHDVEHRDAQILQLRRERRRVAG
ncbi:MAG: hypothetical protein EBY49_09745, partial [Actinobacteria bacterium]|nr:hypothetical protein [Actinomycetota bacterium]